MASSSTAEAGGGSSDGTAGVLVATAGADGSNDGTVGALTATVAADGNNDGTVFATVCHTLDAAASAGTGATAADTIGISGIAIAVAVVVVAAGTADKRAPKLIKMNKTPGISAYGMLTESRAVVGMPFQKRWIDIAVSITHATRKCIVI